MPPTSVTFERRSVPLGVTTDASCGNELPTKGKGSEGSRYCFFLTQPVGIVSSDSVDVLCELDAEVVASLPTPREQEFTNENTLGCLLQHKSCSSDEGPSGKKAS
mmetsp:Transcript_50237/g.96993  ORF Transcript_50237/g.96993 Transcript_50237/m.96993 type:complete len:105 (+) Transcript_50237:1068-1382(+)